MFIRRIKDWLKQNQQLKDRLKQNYQLTVLLPVGMSAFCVFAAFAIYRLFRQEWFFALFDITLSIIIVMALLYALRTGKAKRAGKFMLYANYIVFALVARSLGPAVIPWAYPIYVAGFFLTGRRHALVLAMLYMSFLNLEERVCCATSLDRVTFIVTSGLICAYSYAFAYRSQSQHQQLVDLAARDPLTGLLNKRMFQEEIQRAGEVFKRDHVVQGLLLIDIDYFKQVNDQWGHEAGDDALIQLASLMGQSVRQTDRLFRFGGEEFALTVQPDDETSLQVMANKLCQHIEQTLIFRGRPLTVSIGGAILQPGEAVQGWFNRADAALYRAKHQGRNQAVIDTSVPTSLSEATVLS